MRFYSRNRLCLAFISSVLLLGVLASIQTIIEYRAFNCGGQAQDSSEREKDSLKSKKVSSERKSEQTGLSLSEFVYPDPGKAGSGSAKEEMDRLDLLMSTHGAVCRNLSHFGGWIGRKNRLNPDGMWFICLDPEVRITPGKCIVYSVGINKDWTFDEAITKYGCKDFAFDPTIGKPDHYRSPQIRFLNLGLADIDSEGKPGEKGKSGWKTRTLKTLIKDLGHEKEFVDVLKVDIEGDEYTCLPQMLADGTLKKYVKQLAMEFHKRRSAEHVRKLYGIGRWLDRQGFKIINKRQNAICLSCLEVTFVNINLIDLPRN